MKHTILSSPLWRMLPAIAVGLVACGGGGGNDSGNVISSPSTPSSSSGPTAATLSDAFPSLPAFTQPLAALQAPGDNTRWYVVEQGGRVRTLENSSAATTAANFIDLSVSVTSGDEMGLLGMAFHPSYPTDPRVFLSYNATVSGIVVSRISSFTLASGGTTLDPSSEHVLLVAEQPAGETNHKGGNIAFGPDGYLYIGFGDGGGEGDSHGAIGNGQSLTTLLGKILRIDVGPASSITYTIPADNPYAAMNRACGKGEAGGANCGEIFAYGFRNPWRWSFDAPTGDLWVGDVGEQAWEEIDKVTVGGNYGWRCREGAHAFNEANCPTAGLIDPVWEYGRDLGACITGGFVYRGAQSTATQGRYVYGDFISGRIWALMPATSTQSAANVQLANTSYGIASFGQDNAGELYAVDYSGGRIYKLSFS